MACSRSKSLPPIFHERLQETRLLLLARNPGGYDSSAEKRLAMARSMTDIIPGPSAGRHTKLRLVTDIVSECCGG